MGWRDQEDWCMDRLMKVQMCLTTSLQMESVPSWPLPPLLIICKKNQINPCFLPLVL